MYFKVTATRINLGRTQYSDLDCSLVDAGVVLRLEGVDTGILPGRLEDLETGVVVLVLQFEAWAGLHHLGKNLGLKLHDITCFP
jgi:hypothetical protein